MPFLAILKLLPAKDYVYGAIIAALLGWFGWYTYHERHVGAQETVAAVQKASKKAEATAEKQVQKLTNEHAADVAAIEDKYEGMLSDADDAHNADLQRLHDAERYRQANSAVARTLSAPAQAPSGTDSTKRLESISAELADALRKDDAALEACYADRDSLTGK